MKINRSQITGAPSSIMKPRDSSSSVGRGATNNNNINNINNSTIGGRGLSSNYQSIVSHDRHVSFDKNSSSAAYNTNTHNQSHQAANNSTALATLIASGNKYGSSVGNGMSGI